MLLIAGNVAQAKEGAFPLRKFQAKPDSWYGTEKAASLAQNLLSHRSPHGIWPKNINTAAELFKGKSSTILGTFDNGATVGEIRFLARIYRQTQRKQYRQAVKQAIDTMRARLFSRASLITPNLPELELMTDTQPRTGEEMGEAAIRAAL